jgi:hypothetical protein
MSDHPKRRGLIRSEDYDEEPTMPDPTPTPSPLPERIWLQDLDGDGDYRGEVTWCKDKINDTDTEYIRSDVVNERPGLLAEIRRLRFLIRDAAHYVSQTDTGENEGARLLYYELMDATTDKEPSHGR